MQAAFVHVHHVENSVVKRMWDRLKSRGKPHKEVQVACARKLLTVVWAVVRDKTPYVDDPESLKEAMEEADLLMEASVGE